MEEKNVFETIRQMKSTLRALLEQARRIKVLPGRFFQAIASVFSSQGAPREASRGALEMLVQLHPNTSVGAFLAAANDRVELYRYIGYRLQIAEGIEGIPDGCICRVSCFDAGKLIYQEHWKKQVKYVEKTHIESERLSRPWQETPVIDPCNTLILAPYLPGSFVINPYGDPPHCHFV